VTRLLLPEQVARAANLEVAHGDLEARAELGVVRERGQAGTRLRRQLGGVRVEEVRVGEDVGASDAAPYLVQLGEPERVGAFHDECVRLRDVEARLDDRGRDEDVGVAGEERVHALLELLLRHLAVGDEEAQAGAQLLELLPDLVDRLDPIVEVEGLPSACVLALERHLDELFVVLAHRGSDRAAS
jgi:hypothetical protein